MLCGTPGWLLAGVNKKKGTSDRKQTELRSCFTRVVKVEVLLHVEVHNLRGSSGIRPCIRTCAHACGLAPRTFAHTHCWPSGRQPHVIADSSAGHVAPRGSYSARAPHPRHAQPQARDASQGRQSANPPRAPSSPQPSSAHNCRRAPIGSRERGTGRRRRCERWWRPCSWCCLQHGTRRGLLTDGATQGHGLLFASACCRPERRVHLHPGAAGRPPFPASRRACLTYSGVRVGNLPRDKATSHHVLKHLLCGVPTTGRCSDVPRVTARIQLRTLCARRTWCRPGSAPDSTPLWCRPESRGDNGVHAHQLTPPRCTSACKCSYEHPR